MVTMGSDISNSSPVANARQRRFDPHRRERILTVTLDVIAEKGLSGATMRVIAEAADVSLGSMTYYFADRDALLLEAFEHFATEIEGLLIRPLEETQSPGEMLDLVTDLICGSRWATRRNLLLSYELYAWASRCPEVTAVVHRGIEGMRAALTRFFTKPEADAIDALFDGASIHRAYDSTPPSREEIRSILARIGGA